MNVSTDNSYTVDRLLATWGKSDTIRIDICSKLAGESLVWGVRSVPWEKEYHYVETLSSVIYGSAGIASLPRRP